MHRLPRGSCVGVSHSARVSSTPRRVKARLVCMCVCVDRKSISAAASPRLAARGKLVVGARDYVRLASSYAWKVDAWLEALRHPRRSR